jgi:hypothetical protein
MLRLLPLLSCCTTVEVAHTVVQQVEQLMLSCVRATCRGPDSLCGVKGHVLCCCVPTLGLAEAGCDLAEQVVKVWLWYAA